MDELTPEQRLNLYERNYTYEERVALSDPEKKAVIEIIIGRKLSAEFNNVHDPAACARLLILDARLPLRPLEIDDRSLREEWVRHNKRRTAGRAR